MLQKSVKSLLLQAKRFSALSNWNRHIIVAPKFKGTDFSVPCFYVYFGSMSIVGVALKQNN